MATLIAPSKFAINRDDGTSVVVAAGINHDFPADLVDHWYVKAMGCTFAAEEAATKPEGDDERAALLARANAVGLKVDGRWSLDRLKQEVEAAEEAATKPEGDA